MDLSKVSWKNAKEKLTGQPVMLLFGSVEEHGYHLPMDTDTQIMNAIVESLEQDFKIHHYPAITFGQIKEDGFQEIYILSYPNIDKDVSYLLDSSLPNGIWHAGELETSLMLYLNEKDVDLTKAVVEDQGANRKQQLRGDSWRNFNKSGAFGNPAIATKEKGRKIYEQIICKLKKDLEIILEEE